MKRPIFHTRDSLGCRRVRFGPKGYGESVVVIFRPIAYLPSDRSPRVLIFFKYDGRTVGAWQGGTLREALASAKVSKARLAELDQA